MKILHSKIIDPHFHFVGKLKVQTVCDNNFLNSLVRRRVCIQDMCSILFMMNSLRFVQLNLKHLKKLTTYATTSQTALYLTLF